MSPRRRAALPGDVVGARDVATLLARAGMGRADPDDAVESGAIVKAKVEGVWLFACSSDALRCGEEAVAEAAALTCRDWLLAPIPPLVATVSKDLGSVGITRDAVQAFL